MKKRFAVLVILLAWFGRDGVRAQTAEPAQQTAEAKIAALQKENAELRKLFVQWQKEALNCQVSIVNERALAPPAPPAKPEVNPNPRREAK
jgi:cell division protein FtsB